MRNLWGSVKLIKGWAAREAALRGSSSLQRPCQRRLPMRTGLRARRRPVAFTSRHHFFSGTFFLPLFSAM
jgi:hypothetical protein